jgi:hypothetical protein
MPKKKKAAKAKTSKRKAYAKKTQKRTSLTIKSGYYDKFDEKTYSGPELSVRKNELKTSGNVLRQLEKDVVKQDDEEIPLEKIADEEDELHEDPRAAEEGLGIEAEEAKGQEPYPEIAEAEKDPDEEDEEE